MKLASSVAVKKDFMNKVSSFRSKWMLGQFYKVLQIRNVQEMHWFRSKIVSSGLNQHNSPKKNKYTSLLGSPYITNP